MARRIAGLFASYARQRPQLLADWLDGEHRRPRRRPRLATPAVAGARRPRRRRPAARPPPENRCPPSRIADRPAAAAVAVRPHPAAGHRDRADRRAGHPPRRAPVAAPSQRRPVACPRRRARSHRPPRRHQPPRGRAIRCWPPSAGTCASCRSSCPPICAPTSTSAAATHPDTLLGWLQSDIAANAVRPQGRTLADGDRSVQVHACHGAGPAGGRAARGAARPARRRPDAGATRHPGDVPRHRGLRAADQRRLRPRRRAARRASGAPAADAARGSLTGADQSAAGRRVAAARPWRAAG